MIRTQLYALVLAIALPLMGLLAYAIYDDARHDMQQAGAVAEGLAQTTAAYAEASLENNRTLLARLAGRDVVAALDPSRCDPVFGHFLNLHPEFANIVTIDLKGRPVCSAMPLPGGTKTFFGQADWFQRVLREDRFVVGKPSYGPMADKWISMQAAPIHNDQGNIIGVLAMPMDLAGYLPKVSTATLQPGVMYGILDSEGTVVARFPDPEKWIGRTISGTPLAKALRSGESGQLRANGVDGVENIHGFVAISGSDWHAVAAIPTTMVYTQIRQQATHEAVLTLAILSAVIAVAWALSRKITGPVLRIAEAAKAIGEGRLDARVEVEGSTEIAEVAAQFNKMCDIRQQAGEALRDTSDRCRRLSHRLLEIQETERRHLARELHDEIGQALTAVKIHLQASQRPPTAATLSQTHLEESVRIVEHALEQVRNLSLNLRPPLLDDLGLPAALRWQLDSQAQAAGLSAQFVSGALPDRPHPDVETTCFRVAQEAVTNVIRHAQARQISVELQQREAELHLLIRDDGKGFDAQAARENALRGKSMGLLSMEERVALVGGRLEMHSAPNQGTRVHAILPLIFPARPGGPVLGGAVS